MHWSIPGEGGHSRFRDTAVKFLDSGEGVSIIIGGAPPDARAGSISRRLAGRLAGGPGMSILIRRGAKCYVIPDSLLKKCEISEKDFQKACAKAPGGAEGQEPMVSVCEDYICTDKPTYGASCGRK
jgi:hypothetical protein